MDPAMIRRREEREAARLRKDRRRDRVILIVLVGIIGLFAYSATQQLRSRGASAITIADHQAEASGDQRPAPEFREPALGGGLIHSRDYEGKAVVVNFWASWCGPCRREAPALQRLWEEYEDRGVAFLGVNFRDDEAAALAYEREFAITYPSAADPTGKLGHEFGVLAMPTTFVIDPEGQIRYQYTGVVTEALIRRSIEDVLGGGS